MDLAELLVRIKSEGVSTTAKDLKDLTDQGKRSEQQIDRTTKAMDGMSTMVKRLVTYFAAWKLTQAIKDSALLAARYETMGVVLTGLGNKAGYSTATINDLTKAVEAQGISMAHSRDTIALMAQANLDLKKSTDLARAAQDAAVIANTNSSEAFQRLVYGISSGQTEMLRTLGILVNFETAYQDFATASKKTAASLTEQEKVQIRMNAVLKAAVGIQGTYEAAMGTAGKQINSFKRYVENLQIEFGKAFGPALTDLVQFATVKIKEATEAIKDDEFQGQLQRIAETAKGLFTTLVSMGGKVASIATEAMDAFNSLPDLAKEVGVIGLILFGSAAKPAIATLAAYATIQAGTKSFLKWVQEELANIPGGTTMAVSPQDAVAAYKAQTDTEAWFKLFRKQQPRISTGNWETEGMPSIENFLNAQNQTPKYTTAMSNKVEELKRQLNELGKGGYDLELAKINNELEKSLKAVGEAPGGKETAYAVYTAKKAELDEKYYVQALSDREAFNEKIQQADNALNEQINAARKEQTDAQRWYEDQVVGFATDTTTKKVYELKRYEEEINKHNISQEQKTKLLALKQQDLNKTALQKMLDQWKQTDQLIEDATKNTLQSIQSEFANVISGVLKGEINSLGDAWQAFCDSMINIFANAVAQLVSIWALSGIAEILTGTKLDIGVGGGTTGTVAGAVGGGAVSAGIGKVTEAAIEKLTGISGGFTGLLSTGATKLGEMLGLVKSIPIDPWEADTIIDTGAAVAEAAKTGADIGVSLTTGITKVLNSPFSMSMIAVGVTELIARATGGVGPTEAVMTVLGLVEGGSHTPESAKERFDQMAQGIATDFELIGDSFSTFRERLSMQNYGGDTGLTSMIEDINEMKSLAPIFGSTTDAVEEMISATGEMGDKALYLAGVLPTVENGLNRINQEFLLGDASAQGLSTALIALASHYDISSDKASAWALGLAEGSMTLEQVRKEIENYIIQNLENMNVGLESTNDEIQSLIAGIQGIPTEWSTTVRVNVEGADALNSIAAGRSEIPAFANEGYVYRSGLAWVDEGEKVTKASRPEVGGGGTNVYVDIKTMDGRTLKRQVYRDMGAGGGPTPQRLTINLN